MRIQSGILVFALIVGLILYRLWILLGLSPSLAPWLVVLAVGVGGLICLLASLAQDMANTKEFVKQIAVWLAIMVLLPLAVWYGTSAFSPPPDWKGYSKSTARLQERIREAKGETDKEKLRDEK